MKCLHRTHVPLVCIYVVAKTWSRVLNRSLRAVNSPAAKRNAPPRIDPRKILIPSYFIFVAFGYNCPVYQKYALEWDLYSSRLSNLTVITGEIIQWVNCF